MRSIPPGADGNERKARKRRIETHDELTAQEEQIAWLARDGLSNLEIDARG